MTSPSSLSARAMLMAGLAAIMAPPSLAHDLADLPPPEDGISAQISGTSFITHDAEASAAFYVNYLGFKIARDDVTTSEATRGVYGMLGEESVRVIMVVPDIWTPDSPLHIGIAFAQSGRDIDVPFPMDTQRLPRRGEAALGFHVNDLDAVIARMEADGVPVVVPLALSRTGRSRAITVLDPNGVRVQIYEYL